MSRKNLREDALAIWNAGVDAVRPSQLFRETMQVAPPLLRFADIEFDLRSMNRLLIVGAGKASAAMADALQRQLPESWFKSQRVGGWVNVPEGTKPIGYDFPVTLHEARPAGLNEPTEQGIMGSREILRLVANCSADDLVICLLSGGASALLPLPLPGVSLVDKQAITRALSAAGATIEELNTVRIALSQIKGGQLARACRAKRMLTLVISDVLGDDLRFIGSGPTFSSAPPEPTAGQILDRYARCGMVVPAAVWDVVKSVSIPGKRTSPSLLSKGMCQVEHLILANNATAVDAAGVEAVARGYRYLMSSARRSEGDATLLGRELVERCTEWAGDPEAPDCLISGGEPTVTLAPAGTRGRGGRNQQLVLAALQRRHELIAGDSVASPLCFLSGGTDGEDGPTDVAGAWFDATIEPELASLAMQMADSLTRNDAYSFFERHGGHLRTGPTGTNVCDLRVVVW